MHPYLCYLYLHIIYLTYKYTYIGIHINKREMMPKTLDLDFRKLFLNLLDKIRDTQAARQIDNSE